ncbi:MAG: oligopeptide/dipeptide ABC transporter ATP-binding protein [Vampirovibrionales bacterium]|nr:oligopeptide/dipeptide ABC transporter ATP-binding protein [Vampirovibrionales bacterium]
MSTPDITTQVALNTPPSEATPVPLLAIKALTKRFITRRNWLAKPTRVVHALRGVSLEVYPAEALGIVGESGCGKSTLARAILQLDRPDSGSMIWQASNDAYPLHLEKLKGKALKRWRPECQMVFQNPYASLNPRLTIAQTLTEPLSVHHRGKNHQERRHQAITLLQQVGLSEEAMAKYPHAFSGGQRQRIGIARALALKPKLLVADEPVSALDVSIQAQILNLFKQLQQEHDIALLFVAHNLDVVRYLCDRVAVMYLGQIVELAPTEKLFTQPMHPYTQTLLEARPIADPDLKDRHKASSKNGLAKINQEPASALSPPAGCAFHPRCDYAVERCLTESPSLTSYPSQGNVHAHVACHRAHEWPQGLGTAPKI